MLFDQNRINLQLMVAYENQKAAEKKQSVREIRENRDGFVPRHHRPTR